MKLYSGTLTNRRTWATQDDPRPALTLAFQSYIRHTSVWSRDVSSLQSSDQKCMDFHGSFQIIYGAKPEQDCRALPSARIISSPNRRTWVVDPVRKELKPYCPWLRKAIPDLAYGTSAYSSRFGLRDIGTLFPI